MRRLRWGTAFLLGAFLVCPQVLPYWTAFATLSVVSIRLDANRLFELFLESALFLLLVALIVIPLGGAIGFLLSRSDAPGRRLVWTCCFGLLFAPMPVTLTAWQNAIRAATSWGGTRPLDRPWLTGLLGAVVLQAICSLPWMVLLSSHIWSRVERELEADASLSGSWTAVWRRVTLPRAAWGLAALAAWIVLQAATEITITDLMQVRTYAEEVYTQFVVGDDAALASALLATCPLIAVTLSAIGLAAWKLESKVPAADADVCWRPLVRLGKSRIPFGFALGLVFFVLVLVPVGSLILRSGQSGAGVNWSWPVARDAMSRTIAGRGGLLLTSCLVAAVAGTLTSIAALWCAWLAKESRGFRIALLCVAALSWATPGPIQGIGLRQQIGVIVAIAELGEGTPRRAAAVEGGELQSPKPPGLVAKALYYGPSPAPLLWIYAIRFFPYALAIAWPTLRLMPIEFLEAARVDGAGPIREFSRIIVPSTLSSWFVASGLVMALCLGEVSGGKLVGTPGSDSFAHEVFAQMHYGITAELACLCLLLFLSIGTIAGLLLGSLRFRRHRRQDSR